MEKDSIEDWNSVVFPLTDILLSHPTGCGKTLFAPLRLATQFKAAILVVVPRRIIVQSNLNYYKQRRFIKDVVFRGICRHYDKTFSHDQQGSLSLNEDTKTSITYITAGSLLKRILSNPYFITHYNFIQFDESHSVDIHYVSLLMVFGNISQSYIIKQLPKIVLSTATPSQLLEFLASKIFNLNNATRIFSKKNLTPFPITNIFRPCDNSLDYHKNNIQPMLENMCNIAINSINEWHKQGTPEYYLFNETKIPVGGLFILPGKIDLENLFALIRHEIDDLSRQKIKIVLMYAGCERDTWNFERNIFHIIIATNIAEEGITLPIGFICNSMLTKKKIIEQNDVRCLRVLKISKSVSVQRAGRVGRHSSGIHYMMCSQKEYDSLLDEEIPDTFDGEIDGIICSLIDSGHYLDEEIFPTLQISLRRLCRLGCIDGDVEKVINQKFFLTETKNTTDLGAFAARTPLDPLWSKIIFETIDKNLKYAAIVIATFLDIYANGGFFRGHIAYKIFCERKKLIHPSSCVKTIIKIWNTLMLHDKQKKLSEYTKSYGLDFQSVLVWLQNVKEIYTEKKITMSGMNEISIETTKSIKKHILFHLILNGKLLVCKSSDSCQSVYSDGNSIVLFVSNNDTRHTCLSSRNPTAFLILTMNIMRYVSTNGHDVYTTQM